MENHIHQLLNKFRPGFGLLRSFRGALPAKTPIDVENSQQDLRRPQSRSQDEASEVNVDALQPQIARTLEAKQEDHAAASAAKSETSDNHIENKDTPEPQFTEGPSRFVLAKDGSRDCVALLVNESFLAKLRDLFQEDRDLSALDEPLGHANMELGNIERSLQERQYDLERARTEQEANECYEAMEQQKSKLNEIRHRQNELENERARLKSHRDVSENHTKWVLETAMEKADLLGPEKQTDDSEEGSEVHEYVVPGRTPTESVVSGQEEVQINEEEIRRRSAFEHFIDRSQLFDTIQADFDEQRQNYHDNLTEYLKDSKTGASSMSRSEFDRRSIQYGQQLTRALINIEEEVDEARDQALALNALPSDYGHEFYYGAEYEESWPAAKIAHYIATEDWTFVQSWLSGIPDSSNSSSSSSSETIDDVVEVDEWEAEEVEVNDSVSVMDYEDYRRDIDRYRGMCDCLEDPCPEVRWLGQEDGRVVERRRSCWV